MIKIEIKSVFRKVIFEYECENNTMKKTVEKAIEGKADLRWADLSSSDLRSADLRWADLRSANLRSADLSSAKNKETAYLPIFCKWSHSIIGDKIQIGCKEKTIKEWDLFFNSDKIYSTERNTEDFKQIEAVFNAYKAYLTILNK